MSRPLQFRHRIGLLVLLAATALLAVTSVTLVLGRLNQRRLSGIETRYVPLIELDRDLKQAFAREQKLFEDAAAAAEDAKLKDADALKAEMLRRIAAGATLIADNGGDAEALSGELEHYYTVARGVSAALVAGTAPDQLAPQIEAMHTAQQQLAADLDLATSPDRRRLAAAFADARASQRTSLQIDIVVACVALLLMTLLSWRITSRTVKALHAVSAGVERVARGEFGVEIKVPPGDELGDLAREANRTAGRLRAYREQGEREDWIKTGMAELAEVIAGELEVAALAGKAMRYLARYVDAEAGAVHCGDGAGPLTCVDRVAAPPVGGAARADFRLATTRVDVATLGAQVKVEHDEARSEHVIVVPLLHEQRALGALELALPSEPDARVVELLTRIRGLLGTAVHVGQARERTRSLLLETQRQAVATETANKELEAFSYSVSHDLRAPLRGIDGFSQALLEDYAEQLPAKAQDYLRRIRAAAQRMAELIDDLLQLSRVSRGEFRRERVDLSVIFASVVAELRRAEPERVVDIIVEPGIAAEADSRLVRVVLENLVGNAWKFSAKVASASIELGVRDDGGERVFFVRDNGAGFDMKYADKLFGAFQRLHSDKEFAGTGIGLATVQRVVHRHGGRIWVQSAVSQGATFHFTLPSERRGVSS